MACRFRRFLTALALPWLMLLPQPLLATGALPPRPSEVPLEVPVGDLGQNDRMPESLRARYRPAAAGAVPALVAGALGYPLGQRPTQQASSGWRLADSRNAWRLHTGLDLIVPEGTPVFSLLPGGSPAAGQNLGRVGSSGSASTAHLHFEWRQRRQGRLVAVDPSPLPPPP